MPVRTVASQSKINFPHNLGSRSPTVPLGKSLGVSKYFNQTSSRYGRLLQVPVLGSQGIQTGFKTFTSGERYLGEIV